MAALPTSFMIRLDATGRTLASAVAEDGRDYQMWWEPGFVGGPPRDPVVRDPAGTIVAFNGELVVPARSGRGLHGHALCATGDAMYVLLAVP